MVEGVEKKGGFGRGTELRMEGIVERGTGFGIEDTVGWGKRERIELGKGMGKDSKGKW